MVLKEIVQKIVMELEIVGLILLRKKYVVLNLNIMVLVIINVQRERKQRMMIKFVNILIALPYIMIIIKVLA